MPRHRQPLNNAHTITFSLPAFCFLHLPRYHHLPAFTMATEPTSGPVGDSSAVYEDVQTVLRQNNNGAKRRLCFEEHFSTALTLQIPNKNGQSVKPGQSTAAAVNRKTKYDGP